jgi:hypothetical protein
MIIKYKNNYNQFEIKWVMSKEMKMIFHKNVTK